jgi:kynurenine formamidase
MWFDLSRLVAGDGKSSRAFGLPRPAFNQVADTSKGASVNCTIVNDYCVHSCGTHTEGTGHIRADGVTADQFQIPTLMKAKLVTVTPTNDITKLTDSERKQIKYGDLIVAKSLLESVTQTGNYEALIIRTLPETDLHKDYSGTNPPYVSEVAACFIREHGIKHVLVDLPSVDREDDGGSLRAHKQLLQSAENTITELCFIPANIPDGDYCLNLQYQRMKMDASPSRPLIRAWQSMSTVQ